MAAPSSVLLVEVNEADAYFLEKFVAEGRLPTLAKILAAGARVDTYVDGWQDRGERSWREIMPWILWPTLYTGLTPAEHGLVAFGQDTSPLRGRCVWDVLAQHGVSTGVFGSLLSYPPRNQDSASFYVPESLADDASAFPASAEPVQKFLVTTARNYSESFLRGAVEASLALLDSRKSGVSAVTMARVLAQIPREKILGSHHEAERAMLQTYVARDAFESLYFSTLPRFATFHTNHVAYMQHRYWRAAEPSRFPRALSETDQRFFADEAARDRYEAKLSGSILRSFEYLDDFLASLLERLDERTLLLVATALGQRPIDPVDGCHNPVVRLKNEARFFDALGLRGYRVLHEMNPDLTVTFEETGEAERAVELCQSIHVLDGQRLFHVERRGNQCLLEFVMPRGLPRDRRQVLIHAGDKRLPFCDHVSEHGTNDQSTAQHHDGGYVLAYWKGGKLRAPRPRLRVEEVAPALLGLYGIEPAPWMAKVGPLVQPADGVGHPAAASTKP